MPFFFPSTKYFTRCHWHYLKWLHLAEVNATEQHNYSHGKFSPFDNLAYRLAPPQRQPRSHTHTHNLLTHRQTTKCPVIHTVNCIHQKTKENAGLCFNPRGKNIRCQASSFSVSKHEDAGVGSATEWWIKKKQELSDYEFLAVWLFFLSGGLKCKNT